MEYKKLTEGIFLRRPNRFIAFVDVNGKEEKCHVKNTGRLKELLVAGSRVLLEPADDPNRKTAYSLICVFHENQWVNIDSQVPNKVAKEWILKEEWIKNIKTVRQEKKYGNSRFDLYVETESDSWYIEVKGVTLNRDGIAMFPDAPTERGLKHVKELMECKKAGYRAGILFIIQMKGIYAFSPFRQRQPEFADALQEARELGVDIMAVDCLVDGESIVADQKIEIIL